MSSPGEMNTVKASTIMYIVIGILIPMWPISLPLFWWLAYKSYKNGGPSEISLEELQAAKGLLESGAINQEEYDRVKSRTKGVGTM